jgi:MFS family permease
MVPSVVFLGLQIFILFFYQIDKVPSKEKGGLMENIRERAIEKNVDRFYYGYIVVLACFVILMVIFGIHYTFGLYLKPILAEFGWSRAITSGAYSLSWLLQGPSSLVMGKLNDKYGPRMVLSLCGILLFSGIFLTTQISASWQLYLFYGVFTGIGTGGVYVPIVSTIARWFTEKRATMTGIAISGMGFGTFLLSPVANYLISNYSWRTSYTVLGFVLLIVTLLAAQLLRLKPELSIPMSSTHKVEHEKKALRDDTSDTLKEAIFKIEFWKVFGMFFCFGFCLMAIMVHIAPHAIDIGKSTATATGLIASIGISSIAGKIIFGYFGDSVGSKKVYIICFAIMFVSLLLPISAKEVSLLYIFAIMFGLAYGGNACSQSPLTAEMFGLKSHGAIMGALNIGFTSGATMGPFLAGFLFDINGDYYTAFLVIGSFSFLGFTFAMILKHKMQYGLQ